jgi:hypothetical protein
LHQNALSLIAGLGTGQLSGALAAQGERAEANLGQYDRLRALALLDGEERLAELPTEFDPAGPTHPEVA